MLDDKLTILAGSGIKSFKQRDDGIDLIGQLKKLGYDFVRSVDEIDTTALKVICIDDAMDKATEADNLVIATADHECGALVIVDGDNETGHVTGYYLSDDHTPIYPIVLSNGPGASNFIGKYYQYEMAHKIKGLF